jgi:hypothetical protein
LSSSILGNSGAWSAAGLANATSHESTILGCQLARTSYSPTLRCIVRKKGGKRMLQANISSVSYVSLVCCKCFMWML